MMLLLLCLFSTAQAEQPLMAFGSYPQGASGERQPILWRRLAIEEGRALLLSEYVLDCLPLQDEGSSSSGFEGSSLAHWLRGSFLDASFSEAEQVLIGSDPGALSLPSVAMLRTAAYGFDSDVAREAEGTPYALSRGLKRYGDGSVSYWTADASQSSAASQRRVMEGGVLGIASRRARDIGLRPTLFLPADVLAQAAGTGSLSDPLQPTLSLSAAASPTPSPNPTAVVSQSMQAIEGFPPLTEQGFLPQGEAPHILIDEAAGLWRYADQTLRVEIKRQQLEGPVRYLAAELFVHPDAPQLRMFSHKEGFAREDRSSLVAEPARIARDKGLVFTMDGDYYLYRVGRAKQVGSSYPIGVEIRAGEIIFDLPPSPKRNAYPPLDMMALFPDGDLRVYKANELTAAELLALGASDVLSFGPYLIRDGEVNRSYVNYGNSLQPRAGIGMYEKGHYLAIIVEGRIKPSKGMTCLELAELFDRYGCPTAFNLDGGWTSAMTFMGKQLNQLDAGGVKDNARSQSELMGLGQHSYPPEEKR